MTKGRLVVDLKLRGQESGTADPCTSLRFGRDDKGEIGFGLKACLSDREIEGTDGKTTVYTVLGVNPSAP
jgi:hypothetical protein